MTPQITDHLFISDAVEGLQFSVGFDVVKRYGALGQPYRQIGFEIEAAWTDRRLEKIRRGAGN